MLRYLRIFILGCDYMFFPKKTWGQMEQNERDYFFNQSERELIDRWLTPQGKEIKQKILEVNRGSDLKYDEIIGTVKDNFGKEKPKYDLRGIDMQSLDTVNEDQDIIHTFNFTNCNLKFSNFSNCRFYNADFSNSDLLYCDFSYSILDGCNFTNANLTLSDFTSTSLEYANFKGAWLTGVKFNNSNLGYVKFNNKTDFQNIDTNSFEGSTNPLFIGFIQRKHYLKNFKEAHRVVYYIWFAISNCGQSFLRWFLWSMGICMLFGLLFSMNNNSFLVTSGRALTPFSFYYYSVVTFATLGYGDIVPKTLLGEVLVVTEVIIGYLMLGGLLSIFAEKFVPRK